ncbi:UPF0058 family protein [Halomicroarcula sp. GCM10025817]|uniref:UPF0058 family protein n=1 Tax=Haloarcula TaxID=2237 RepID=UPI003204A9DB
MKRQELIHIHALLFEVGEYLEGDESVPDDVFAHYKTQPTRPQDVHRGKDAHATAVKYLSGHCSQLVDKSHQQTHTSTTDTSII